MKPLERPVWLLAGVFVLSRLVFAMAGIEFNAAPLVYFWQYADPALLRDRLFETLLFMHGQPPLYNLFLGAVLKIFPGHELLAFKLIYLACGLGLTLSLYALARCLDVEKKWAMGLAAAFAVAPATVLYENWLFYTYPTTLLVCVSGVCFFRFVRALDFRWGVAFFGCLTALTLTWSSFHPLWPVLIAVGLILVTRQRWRVIAGAALLPGVLIILLCGKNALLFDRASTSSWLGMSLFKVAAHGLSRDKRQELADAGVISRLAVEPPFIELGRYAGQLAPPKKTGIAILDRPAKSSGARNLNNVAYLEISRRYMNDALALLEHSPGRYLYGVADAWLIYFAPASDYKFLEYDRRRIRTYDKIVNVVLAGQFRHHEFHPRQGAEAAGKKGDGDVAPIYRVGWFLMAGCLLLLVGCVAVLRRAFEAGEWKSPQVLLLAYILATVIYLALIGNFFEVGENNRFRFAVDPLLFAAAAHLVTRWRRAIRTPEPARPTGPGRARESRHAAGCPREAAVMGRPPGSR